MGTTNTCKKQHRKAEILASLPESQAGEGRHKCAGCAYEQGHEDGFNQSPEPPKLSELPYSQAKAGRHKDARAAYHLGYADGLKKATGVGRAND